MQMKPGKYKNRTVARGVSHMVNDISRMQSRNERIKRETYGTYSDEEFYRIYKPWEDYKDIQIKNRFIIKRLREIERKRGIATASNTGCLTTILLLSIGIILLLLYICI